MNSPLGKYATITAAILAIGIVAAYILALVFQSPLGIDPLTLSQLHDMAFIAVGAVFGSAVAVNGYKGPLDAVHKRLDEAGIPPAKDGTS